MKDKIKCQQKKMGKEPEANERRSDLVASALDSGLSGPDSSPGQETALSFWANHFIFIMPPFIQVLEI